MVVMLAEDGTRVTPTVEYEKRSNALSGLVAPLGNKGLPTPNYFDATNADEVARKLDTSPVASTAYVQLAIPMVPNAAPYVLFYMATNNKFTYADLLKRWHHEIELLGRHGIAVFGIGGDGDTKVLKSMVSITEFLTEPCSPLGEFFALALEQRLRCYQDPPHTLNKVRRKLFCRPGTLMIGRKRASIKHLDTLVQHHSKDKHRLTYADLNPTDLMSFKPTEKIMSENVIDCLEKHVPDSQGTVALLRYMRATYRAFTDETLQPLESIALCWYISLFILPHYYVGP